MNYRLIFKVLGKTMLMLAVLMIIPLVVAMIYGENRWLAFLVPMGALVVIGLSLSFIKLKDKTVGAKEGFVIVALCWIMLSVFGCLPYIISGEIPSFVDAFFETVSGFTTTGSSILDDVEIMSRSTMFWRMFAHWIGGMGVLVFVLTIIPESEMCGIYIYSAESPGPSSSKMVGKMRHTARILYGIYVILTIILVIFLLCGGMSFYDSLLNTFSIAGTGGLSVHNGSITYYQNIANINIVYTEIVMTVFMFLFSINFNLYFFIITGNVLKALKSEEFLFYTITLLLSSLVIAINIMDSVNNFGTALRQATFQVSSISSTTGFASVDFNNWPTLSKAILTFLMIMGACGGSTGGGVKASRFVILLKSSFADMRHAVNPREVLTVRFEGKPVSKGLSNGVYSFFVLYIFITIASTLLLSIDSFAKGDVFTNLSATLTCISNVGPGFNLVGPMYSFAGYSWFSKLVLSFVMLVGRLEIYPMIILFAPRTWRR